MIAQRNLNVAYRQMNATLEHLATGLRISRGKDDPAGLIVSERLRSKIGAVGQAISNTQRAKPIIATTEGALAEVSNLLNGLEDLVDRTANESGISTEERDANQLEIDNILASINRIAASTELQGRRLLSGDLAYTTSGVFSANIAALHVNSARIPEGGYRTVGVDVIVAAALATVNYTGGTLSGSPRTIEVTGNLGSERLTFASGATVNNIASAVNQSVALTGVSASVSGTASVIFNSTEYGSSQFVRVRALSGTFAISGGGEDYGNDVQVTINGMTAAGDGLKVGVRIATLDADIILASAFATDPTLGTSTFSITGGGAKFMISPRLDLNSVATLGIDSVSTTGLGDGNTGYLYSLGTGEANAMNQRNFYVAQRIVRNSLSQVATFRGRLGSFEKNTLDTTLNSLKVQYENLAAAESAIRGTDFAAETSNLTGAQILVQSAATVLRLANQAPQNVLALLG